MKMDYAKIFTEIVNETVNKSRRFTKDLDENAAYLEYLGGKKIAYPVFEMSGLVNHQGVKGFEGKVGSDTHKFVEVEMQYDRGFRQMIDERDVDETNFTVRASSILLHKTVKINEDIDAGRFSAIGGGIDEENATSVKLTAANVMQELRKAITQSKMKYRSPQAGGGSDHICYVSMSTYMLMLENTSTTKIRDVQGVKFNENTDIAYINGVKIVQVPDDLMVTNLEFGEFEGFKTSAESKQIDFIVLPFSSVAVPVQIDRTKVFTPDTDDNGDRYRILGRVFHGAFVLEGLGKKEAIFANLSDVAKGTEG